MICLKCLEKDPRRRYATRPGAGRRPAAPGWPAEPIAARPVGALERAAKLVRRRPTLAAAYALTAAVLVLAGSGGASPGCGGRRCGPGWRRSRHATARRRRGRRRDSSRRRARRGRRREGSRRRGEGAGRGRAAAGEGRAGRVRPDDRGGPPGVAGEQRRRHPGLARQHPGRPPRLGVALRPSPLPFRPAHPQGAHRSGQFGVVQPRRVAGRHRELRTRRRRSGTRGRGAEILTLKGHTDRRHLGVVQPRRLADRHRELGQDGEGLGRADAAPRSSPSRGTPIASTRRRSARTGRGSSPRAATGRRRSGTRGRGAEVLTLKGHTGRRHLGVVQPATARGSSPRVGTGTAKVWDARTGAEVLTLKGHTGDVVSASFSPDGSRIVTGELGRDGEGLGRDERRRGPHAQGAHRMSSSRRRSARTARGSSPGVRTGRRRSGTRRRAPSSSPSRGTPDSVNSASFSPDGSRIVTGSDDRTAKVWDATIGTEGVTLTLAPAPARIPSFSPDGCGRWVTASSDGTAKVWDAGDADRVLTLRDSEHLPLELSCRRRSARTGRGS